MMLIKMLSLISYSCAVIGVAWGQVAGADWATEFLFKWGWLGLFVISAFVNVYLFREIKKERLRAESKLDEARNELETELRKRIDQLYIDAKTR